MDVFLISSKHRLWMLPATHESTLRFLDVHYSFLSSSLAHYQNGKKLQAIKPGVTSLSERISKDSSPFLGPDVAGAKTGAEGSVAVFLLNFWFSHFSPRPQIWTVLLVNLARGIMETPGNKICNWALCGAHLKLRAGFSASAQCWVLPVSILGPRRLLMVWTCALTFKQNTH